MYACALILIKLLKKLYNKRELVGVVVKNENENENENEK